MTVGAPEVRGRQQRRLDLGDGHDRVDERGRIRRGVHHDDRVDRRRRPDADRRGTGGHAVREPDRDDRERRHAVQALPGYLGPLRPRRGQQADPRARNPPAVDEGGQEGIRILLAETLRDVEIHDRASRGESTPHEGRGEDRQRLARRDDHGFTIHRGLDAVDHA